MSEPEVGPPAIEPLPLRERYEVSAYQRGMWSLLQIFPDNPFYNASRILRLDGPLDFERFLRALQAHVDRHFVWRTAIHADEDGPYQRVEEHVELECELEDVSELRPEEAEARFGRWLAEAAWEPFDLAVAPLARWRAFRFGPADHRVVMTVHHVILDGGSVKPMLEEIAALYVALGTGAEPPPPPRLQYVDFCHWQNRRLGAGELASSERYWLRRLGGELPPCELPTDRTRSSLPSHRGSQRRRFLPLELSDGLRELRRRCDTTLYRTCLAALQILLARLTGETDVVVGSPVSGRTHPALAEVLGMFVNMVAMRTCLDGDPSFREVLERVKESTAEALEHKELPFDEVVQRLRLPWDPGRSPVFRAVLIMREPSFTDIYRAGDLVITQDEAPVVSYSRYDLLLMVAKVGERLRLTLSYTTDVLDAATVDRWLGQLERLIAGAIADPELPISRLPLLAAAERHQVLLEWNDTDVQRRDGETLASLLSAAAERTPDATAVVFEGAHLSYGRLRRESRRLAAELGARAAGPETRVGVCVERSLELAVALAAILEAGAAYVPLDPEHPPARLATILEEAAPVVLVATPATRGVLAATAPRLRRAPTVIEVEPGRPRPPVRGASVARAAEPDNLAYVIYTSGSTGRPKGAMNSHRAIVNRLLWMQSFGALDATDRVLQKTPFSFDVSVWELFWPLITGATLVVARPRGHREPDHLAELILRERVTTVHFVPSMLRVFVEEVCRRPHQRPTASLRRVIASGEALPRDLEQRALARLLPGRPEGLYNLYGPTEAAVDVTWWRCRATDSERPVPIGRPVDCTRTVVRDRWGLPAPVGVAGELLLGGVQVARGYLARPALTAERFVPDPLAGRSGAGSPPGSRLYRTGDRARVSPTGEIEFLGRLDHQVKIRGMRIELGEVEAALGACPGVLEAAVTAREDRPGETRLVGYYVPAGDPPPAPGELRAALAGELPAQMVPSALIRLDSLPRTASGKLDRKPLPRPGEADAGAKGAAETWSPLQEALSEIWQEVLGVRPARRDDSFFDLGGHSLTAVTLVHRIDSRLGARLSVAELVQAPTVAGLSALIARSAGAAGSLPANVVLLRSGTEGRRPLFVLHAFRGGVFPFGTLARSLPGTFPVYGLQAPGLEAGEKPLRTIAEMADHAVAAVRRLQPEGPYRLLGWSFGGTLAWEAARRLEAEGSEVDPLLLLDAVPAEEIDLDPERLATPSRIGETFFDLPSERFAGLGERDGLALLLAEAGRRGDLARGMTVAELERLIAVIRANAEALRGFRLEGRTRADLVLVLAAGGSHVRDNDSWRARTEGWLRVLEVPGTHHGMIEPPAVYRLAEVLGPHLEAPRSAVAEEPEPFERNPARHASRLASGLGATRRCGLGGCPLVLGECVQGWLPEHEHFLITSPIDLFAWAEFHPDTDLDEVRVLGGKTKVRTAISRYLELAGLPPGGVLELHTPVEPGLGFGTSTADMVAGIRAAASAWGRRVAAETVVKLAVAIEPTDGSMFPGAVVFAHRHGVLLERLGPLPPFHAVAVWTADDMIDTVSFDERRRHFRYSPDDQRTLRTAWELVRQAVRWQDLSLLGEATTLSAQINEQFLPKPYFGALHDLSQELGAEGLVAAHSGTVLAVLFDPADPAFRVKIEAALRFVETLGPVQLLEVANVQERREIHWRERYAAVGPVPAAGAAAGRP